MTAVLDDAGKEILRKKLKQAFEVFDHKNEGRADVREIGTIIRALNLAPSEKRLAELLVELEEEETPTSVRYEKFEKVVMRLMEENEPDLQRDSEAVLLKAFKVFDPENTGQIEISVLKESLMNEGEAFSAEMVDQMVKSMGATGDTVDYNRYISVITSEK